MTSDPTNSTRTDPPRESFGGKWVLLGMVGTVLAVAILVFVLSKVLG